MAPDTLPYATGWWSFELPGARACDSTYCLFPYESLPPLPMTAAPGMFEWLQTDDSLVERMTLYRAPGEVRDRMAASLRALAAESAALGCSLPNSFLKFMSRPDLQDRIPSCTACYFDLSANLTPAPLVKDGYCIRFLNDQQGVLFWYLFVNRAGEQCVLASPIGLDDDEAADLRPQQIAEHLYYCAPSFDEFLYRLWLENSIWFAAEAGRALTASERAYVRHYKAQGRRDSPAGY